MNDSDFRALPLENASVGRRTTTCRLNEAPGAAHGAELPVVTDLAGCSRRRHQGVEGVERLIDRFRDAPEIECVFLRAPHPDAHIAELILEGSYTLGSCPAGGWLAKPHGDGAAYWIPVNPTLRTTDARGRILSEQTAPLRRFEAAPTALRLEVDVPAGSHLDCVVWRLPQDASDIIAGLEQPLVVELQPLFMWGSHTNLRGPAELYRYLLHGHVYENRFEWRKKWKICAENEAYSLYVALHGLECASGKRLYGLFRRQLVVSVVSRQSEDGGWYHGEWSDFMESHYRLHNGGVLLLEAALEEHSDPALRSALTKAAAFTARHTDNTELGLWFLHDSLEEDVELLRKSGSRLIPSRVLGKSPGTKLILNTHLDSIVVLDRYRQVTGDEQYLSEVESARSAARRLLALRPAEALYRLVSWAVGLTMIPPSQAERLSLPLRAARRAARERLLPGMYRIKRVFPRMVMPDGLIDRHLSMPHYDVNYQAVNLMDLARLWRRFPDEDLGTVVSGAIAAVRESGLLQYWIESKQRQGLGYWVEALYHLCMLNEGTEYRRYLAEAIIITEEAGFGLPPSLLGANAEVVPPAPRFPCPCPADPRLRIANLSSADRREVVAVNPSASALGLVWEKKPQAELVWKAPDGCVVKREAPLAIGPRSWLWGTEDDR
jgi:hypothetical protein